MKQTLYQNPLTDQYDGGSCPSVAAKEEHLRQIGHDESITSPRAGSKEATIKLWVTWSEHRRSRATPARQDRKKRKRTVSTRPSCRTRRSSSGGPGRLEKGAGEHVPKVKSVLSGSSRVRCRAGLLGTARGQATSCTQPPSAQRGQGRARAQRLVSSG